MKERIECLRVVPCEIHESRLCYIHSWADPRIAAALLMAGETPPEDGLCHCPCHADHNL